jgi:hypothetical protein
MVELLLYNLLMDGNSGMCSAGATRMAKDTVNSVTFTEMVHETKV